MPVKSEPSTSSKPAAKPAASAGRATTKPSPAKTAARVEKRGAEKKDKKVKKPVGKEAVKVKVVRDSFTMPQNDYERIAELKEICLKADVHVKKSELLRAGLHALGKLSVPQLKQIILQMEHIKTGRPKKD